MESCTPLTVALGHLVERIKNDDLVMVVASININRQIGGNLADILETTGETIRERFRIKREIEVLTAQQRYSGYVLVALPIILTGVLMVQLLPLALTFLGAIVIMAWLDPLIALLAALLMPVYYLAMKILGRKIRPLTAES